MQLHTPGSRLLHRALASQQQHGCQSVWLHRAALVQHGARTCLCEEPGTCVSVPLHASGSMLLCGQSSVPPYTLSSSWMRVPTSVLHKYSSCSHIPLDPNCGPNVAPWIWLRRSPCSLHPAPDFDGPDVSVLITKDLLTQRRKLLFK